MSITREQLKNIVKETLKEESEYQVFFRKALEKAGKSIPSMSDEEKKEFFNKIDKAWNGKGEKNEGNAFGAAVVAAKEKGEDEFEVDGKTYKVESVNEENTRLNKKVKSYLDAYLKGEKKNSPEHQHAIMLIMKGALTDANFHSEAKKLDKFFPKAKQSKHVGTPMEDVIEDKGVDIAGWAKWDGYDIIDAFTFYTNMTIGGKFGDKFQSLKTESVNESASCSCGCGTCSESINEAKIYKVIFTGVQEKDAKDFFTMIDKSPKIKAMTKDSGVFKVGNELTIRFGVGSKQELELIKKVAKLEGLKIVKVDEAVNEAATDRDFEKVYSIFDKKDYFGLKGSIKTMLGNWQRALDRGDKGAQQYSKEDIIKHVTDNAKARAKHTYDELVKAIKNKDIKALKSKLRHDQKFSLAIFTQVTGKKLPKSTRDIHSFLDNEFMNESITEARLGKVSLLKSVENGETSRVEGVNISPELAFELRMFLQRPLMARSRTGIQIDNAQMKDAIPMLAKVGVHKRLSSGVKKEFTNLLKKYK